MNQLFSGEAIRGTDKRRDQLAFAQSMLRGSFDPVVRGDELMLSLLAQLDQPREVLDDHR